MSPLACIAFVYNSPKGMEPSVSARDHFRLHHVHQTSPLKQYLHSQLKQDAGRLPGALPDTQSTVLKHWRGKTGIGAVEKVKKWVRCYHQTPGYCVTRLQQFYAVPQTSSQATGWVALEKDSYITGHTI